MGAAERGRHHLLGERSGDREADPRRRARTGEDRGVHADQVAVHVDQRPAGVARIDGRVGLDERRDAAGADLGARQRRDDAVGHRLADAERITDRQHQVADLHVGGVVDRDGRQLLGPGVDLQHGEIGARIVEQHLGRPLAAVGRHHGDLLRALDDVMVGQDHAVRPHDRARAQRLGDALLRDAAAHEHAPEGVDLGAHHTPRIDVDHGGRGPLHDRGKRKPHGGGVAGDLAITSISSFEQDMFFF